MSPIFGAILSPIFQSKGRVECPQYEHFICTPFVGVAAHESAHVRTCVYEAKPVHTCVTHMFSGAECA